MPEKGLFDGVRQELAFKAVRLQLLKYLNNLIDTKRPLKVGMGVEVVFKASPLYHYICDSKANVDVGVGDMSVVFARVNRECSPNGLCYVIKKIN